LVVRDATRRRDATRLARRDAVERLKWFRAALVDALPPGRVLPPKTCHRRPKLARATDRSSFRATRPTLPALVVSSADAPSAHGGVHVVAAIAELPSVPAIYPMYGGEDRRVGIGDDLRRRITQHLVNRNSSATTDTGAVRLHPDHISSVSWWEHPNSRTGLNLRRPNSSPSTCSNRRCGVAVGITAAAKQRAADYPFRDEMTAMFADAPTGRLELLTLAGLVKRLAALERCIKQLENHHA
jgi:hypothetical protein